MKQQQRPLHNSASDEKRHKKNTRRTFQLRRFDNLMENDFYRRSDVTDSGEKITQFIPQVSMQSAI
jgi:hypothetical protein